MMRTTIKKRLGKSGYRKYVRSASNDGCGCGKKAKKARKVSMNQDKEIKFI